jgi:imidazole glycerol-phosphate synthase subunit HisH
MSTRSKTSVAVINYGVGNLGSVCRAFDVLGAPTRLITKPDEIATAERLILPGVGAFSSCIQAFRAGGWESAFLDVVKAGKIPVLGVCVGMQMLATSSSEFGESKGLDIIDGSVKHLGELGCNLRVPHAGWNDLVVSDSDDPLLASIPTGSDFYFVHSYSMVPKDTAHIKATTNYGADLTAVVRAGNVWGVQFHPEKSSSVGQQLLRNFLELKAC